MAATEPPELTHEQRLARRAHVRSVWWTAAGRGPAAAAVVLFARTVAGLVALSHLDGRANDAADALIVAGSPVSLQSIVVAGVVLGALGALTDTAVTQAS
jgi:hypothetical protein